jgi:hypothetical protein
LGECLQRSLLLSSGCGPTLRFSEGVWALSTWTTCRTRSG